MMNRTILNLFKEANYSAFEHLDLELDAREMKFFLSEQYISTQIVLSEEEFYSLRVAQEYCVNNKDRNLLKYAKMSCYSAVPQMLVGGRGKFLKLQIFFWDILG